MKYYCVDSFFCVLMISLFSNFDKNKKVNKIEIEIKQVFSLKNVWFGHPLSSSRLISLYKRFGSTGIELIY